MNNNNKKHVLIAGGDGLVGRHLTAMIDKSKYHITVLSRKKKASAVDGIDYGIWDSVNKTIDKIPYPDHIINLAGAGIADSRWSDARKKELISSRVDSAETIEKYLKVNQIKPLTYISASAVGYYGNRGNELLDESSKPGSEFMSECCIAWENAATKAGALCDRTVILRIGIVLTSLGGALPKMLMTKDIGLFNYFGNGAQYYPWIHIDDLCRMILAGMENQNMNGIYNAASPQQITNKEMMEEIKNGLHHKGFLLPVPEFGLRLILGEMANVVLNSDRVSVDRLISTGFNFTFNKVGEAVLNLLKRKI